MRRAPKNSQVALEGILICTAMNQLTKSKLPNRPNMGGTISGTTQPGLKFSKKYEPSAYNPDYSRQMNLGGTITKSDGTQREYAASNYNPGMTRAYPEAGTPAPSTPMTPAPLGRPMVAGPGAAQVSQPGSQPAQAMNQGGTITTSGGLTRAYAPTPYAPGVIPPPQPAQPPAPPQTEGANPMTGTTSKQVPGTTSSVNTASSALGFSARGNSVPSGQDMLPGVTGKSGLSQQQFVNRKSSNAYDDYASALMRVGAAGS